MDGYFDKLDASFYNVNNTQFLRTVQYRNSYRNDATGSGAVDRFFKDGIIGQYSQGTNIYKRENAVYINGQLGYVTTLVRFSDNGQLPNSPSYECYMETQGILSERPFEDALLDGLHSIGIGSREGDQETLARLKEYMLNEQFGLENTEPVLIDAQGVFNYFGNFIDKIREWFINEYDDTTPNNAYSFNQEVYPNGLNTITEWNNSDIDSLCGYAMYNNSIGAYTNDYFFNEINKLKENNELVKSILNKPIVRVLIGDITSSTYGTYTRMCINGYDIPNNNVVVSTESEKDQYFTVTGNCRCTGIDMVNPLGTFVEQERWVSIGMERDLPFYNYPRYNVVADKTGGGTGTSRYWTCIIDSVGNMSAVKNYQVLPNATPPNPNSPSTSDNYPDWNETIINEIVIRPVSINVNIQDWRGLPDINITYPQPTIINRPIIIIIEPSPPTKRSTPENSDYGLFTIYLPNNTKPKGGVPVDVMGQVTGNLWKPSIFERIQRIFKNNPLDAVISLHEIYLNNTAIIGGDTQGHHYNDIRETDEKPVYFGNVLMQDGDSTCAWTKKRYLTFTMGSIPIKLDFDDYRDYQRGMEIYLPFIGFQTLNINDFTGKGTTNIELEYTVDLLTGDLVANLYINKDGLTDDKFMYSWSGNFSSTLPLSSNDKSRLFNNSLGALGSIATAVATGGKSAIIGSVIGGGVNVATGSQSTMQRSGAISGNLGVMNYKEAFVIINKPKPLDVTYNDLSGYSTNIKVRLGALTGFTRVKECHVDTIPNASDNEKDMIYNILKNGIIM